MCGIAGILHFKKEVSKVDIKALCDKLSKRGPDAEGFFIEKGIGLGHRRLSIIDLDTGDQPMFSNDGNIVLVYNGEIYNFPEIRADLEKEGVHFATHSDTEVVIEGYKYYGIKDLLDKAEGMFAFALYDRKNEKVFIARDKFGEKPLYYFQDEEKFVFASELKAIEHIIPHKKINLTALNLFLSLSYIPAPYTIYEGVYKLEAGHFFEISLRGVIEKYRYYNLSHKLKEWEPYKSFEDACGHLETLLTESVQKRMIADVPVGSFLSGGIDSSIITCLMAKVSGQKVKTFSIGFRQKDYDESKRAEIIARHIDADHSVEYLDYHDVVDHIDEILHHFDEPFGDSSAIPSFYVAKVAAEKVKVVLTGDCADELFAGYDKYLGSYYSKKYNILPRFIKKWISKTVNSLPYNQYTNSILRRVKKVIQNSETDHFEMHYRYMCMGFNEKERNKLVNSSFFEDIRPIIHKIYHSFDEKTDMEKGFYTDLNLVLEGDMLVKVDRMCMKNSLEARVPFLDSKIVEAAYTMPLHYKLKGRNKKYILKKTFENLLPKKTLKFRKKGFGTPVDYWFNNELKEDLDTLLSTETLKKQQIFNIEYIDDLVKAHRAGKQNNKSKLWNLYVFQKWYFKNNMSDIS
ncbi:MAG: asparagine synthase (glutamine-hydrolyzing) [Saprospiraceae bacterium]|nr:asparagine synthase (glutamine-hydrolyzing) [Saprospiraceae bacterium]